MVSILYLVERLAANVFAATYRLSINRLRSARAALILAYTGYYATICILLALVVFAAMAATSAMLMICFPELYYRLAEMRWIPQSTTSSSCSVPSRARRRRGGE